MHHAYEDIRVRGYARWFDYSTPTSIECVVESLRQPLPSGSLAAVNITIVNSTIMLDDETLDARLEATFENYNCEELSHCRLKNDVAQEVGWFGAGWEFLGTTQRSPTILSQQLCSLDPTFLCRR